MSDVKEKSHLVFYDGECGLCDQLVQCLIQYDKQKLFMFAPLQGETAEKFMKQFPPEYRTYDTLFLVENYHTDHWEVYTFGKAALRILWLMGYVSIGWIHFLPPFLYNWVYRFIAKNRNRLFAQACIVPTEEHRDRFLP